jgi:prephenate dehydrogenase
MPCGMNIGICGLGLIGGSLAKALRLRGGVSRIVAIERDEKSLRAAIQEGVIDSGSIDEYGIFMDSDIVFVCTPIDNVAECVRRIAEISGALITDTASAKNVIMQEVPEDIRFIGGHPMTGSERNGYFAAEAGLFENAVYALIPREDTSFSDYELLSTLIENIGALPLKIRNDLHDRAVGAVSHLPHVVAAALVVYVSGKDDSGVLSRLAAGGFKDITRIASSDPKLWKQILLSSDGLEGQINDFIVTLETFRDALKKKDGEALSLLLRSARGYRDSLVSLKGLVKSEAQLLIEVSDRPGIIGEVATLLGTNYINIKNLYIENNREYEGGVLRITLERAEDSEKAIFLLTEAGHRCRTK